MPSPGKETTTGETEQGRVSLLVLAELKGTDSRIVRSNKHVLVTGSDTYIQTDSRNKVYYLYAIGLISELGMRSDQSDRIVLFIR